MTLRNIPTTFDRANVFGLTSREYKKKLHNARDHWGKILAEVEKSHRDIDRFNKRAANAPEREIRYKITRFGLLYSSACTAFVDAVSAVPLAHPVTYVPSAAVGIAMAVTPFAARDPQTEDALWDVHDFAHEQLDDQRIDFGDKDLILASFAIDFHEAMAPLCSPRYAFAIHERLEALQQNFTTLAKMYISCDPQNSSEIAEAYDEICEVLQATCETLNEQCEAIDAQSNPSSRELEYKTKARRYHLELEGLLHTAAEHETLFRYSAHDNVFSRSPLTTRFMCDLTI